MDLLLGIDIGTTSVKAGLFSPDGACLGIEREEYQLSTPAPDRAELAPEIYWQACIRTVKKALSMAKIHPEDVKALAVSSQGETTIALDRDGRAVYPAIIWLDNRAVEEAAKLAAHFSGEVYRRTGIPEIVPTWPACKILWLKNHEREVFARTAKFLLVQDYLIYHLTGRYVTDGSISCTSLYYDLTRNAWWPEMLQACGIREDQLPEIVQPGTAVGRLSAAAAADLGLTTSTLVVTGGMDQSVGAIGAGNIAPGHISETTGAALAIQATISDPLIDQTHTVPVYYHSIPGRYLFVPVCPTAGMAFKWLKDTFFQDEVRLSEAAGEDVYDRLTALAEAVPPGSDGLLMLPHLMGAFSPEPNPYARGTFTGFSLNATRGHFVRALLEGVSFMLRRNLETIERTGIQINGIVSTGGGARSRLWKQMKADICNRPVITLANEETGLLGDAILAGVAAGVFSSIEAGCLAMVSVKETILPGESQAVYEEPYRRYCELDRHVLDFYRPADQIK